MSYAVVEQVRCTACCSWSAHIGQQGAAQQDATSGLFHETSTRRVRSGLLLLRSQTAVSAATPGMDLMTRHMTTSLLLTSLATTYSHLSW